MAPDQWRANPEHTPATARAVIDSIDTESDRLAKAMKKLRDRRRRVLRRTRDTGIVLNCDRCGGPGAAFRRREAGLICDDCVVKVDTGAGDDYLGGSTPREV